MANLTSNNAGRPRKYMPDELESQFDNYLKWVANNPLRRVESFKGVQCNLEIDRPLSVQAFCAYAKLCVSTLYDYFEVDEYSEICSRIRTEIAAEQLTGAIANVYNSNLVARINGLVDKSETEHKGNINVEI